MLKYIIILYLFTQFKDSRIGIVKTEINQLKVVNTLIYIVGTRYLYSTPAVQRIICLAHKSYIS